MKRVDHDAQLHLFGPPPAAPNVGPVGPAEFPPELVSIASALPPEIRLGTSSWSFPGWEGLVYDRAVTQARLARQGLTAYARHPLFRAVGLDRTFCAPIPESRLAGYAAEVPADFRFLVKACGECTSTRGRNPTFLNASYAVDQVVGPYAAGLGSKAGSLLFQFPPVGPELKSEPGRFAEGLGSFLDALPDGVAYSVELRDRELMTAPYFEALSAAGATHCISVHPRMPPVAEQCDAMRSAGGRGPVVVRWMLHAGLGFEEARERYEPFSQLVDEDPQTRAALGDLGLEHARAGREVLIIANNKAEGAAPLTVRKLAEQIRDRLAGAEA